MIGKVVDRRPHNPLNRSRAARAQAEKASGFHKNGRTAAQVINLASQGQVTCNPEGNIEKLIIDPIKRSDWKETRILLDGFIDILKEPVQSLELAILREAPSDITNRLIDQISKRAPASLAPHIHDLLGKALDRKAHSSTIEKLLDFTISRKNLMTNRHFVEVLLRITRGRISEESQRKLEQAIPRKLESNTKVPSLKQRIVAGANQFAEQVLDIYGAI